MQVPISGSGVAAIKCWGDVPELPFSALAARGAQPPWDMLPTASAAA